MTNTPTSFEITYKSLFRVGVGVSAFFLLGKLVPIILFLLIAILVGVGLSPIVGWAKKHKISTWLANTLVTLAILAFVIAILGFLLPSVVSQITDFAKHLPEYRKKIEETIVSPGMRDFVHSHLEKMPEEVGSVPEKAAQVGGITINIIYQFVLLIILSIYFLIDGKRTYQAILSKIAQYSSPETKTKVEKTITEVREVIIAYAKGQLLTCAFVAVYTYAVTLILHIPGALTLAAIATICDLVPVVGFISSLALSSLVALTVSPMTSLILAGLYVGYSVIENYIIIPRVYGETMKLSRLAVLLSILAGGALGGITGMFLILPLVGSWHSIEKYWIKEKSEWGQNT